MYCNDKELKINNAAATIPMFVRLDGRKLECEYRTRGLTSSIGNVKNAGLTAVVAEQSSLQRYNQRK